MATGDDDNNVDGDGTTGNEVGDDGDGAVGDDNDGNDDGNDDDDRNSDGAMGSGLVLILAGALFYGTVMFQKNLVSNFFVPLSTTYLSYQSSVQ